jgi:hypothetical protein
MKSLQPVQVSTKQKHIVSPVTVSNSLLGSLIHSLSHSSIPSFPSSLSCPGICQWNLSQLANALLAAQLAPKEDLEESLSGGYTDAFLETYESKVAQKLGLKVRQTALRERF